MVWRTVSRGVGRLCAGAKIRQRPHPNDAMADNPKKKGRDRELVSEQEHEVAYLMKAAKVTRQKALEGHP